MPVEAAIIAFEEQAEVLGSLDVGTMWERLRGEFLGEWSRLQRQNLPEAEVERELRAFMDALSEKPVEDLARKSSAVAYNQGRAAEIVSQDAVQFVVRSEVLDPNTCDTCASLDGAVVDVADPDFHRLMPPNLCEGGDRCRGFYIAVTGV